MSVKESKQSLQLMATPDFNKEMSALIRSRSPLIYLVTTEEKRMLEWFRHFTVAGGYQTFVWDCFNGILNIINMEPSGLITGNSTEPVEMLDWIVKETAEEELDNNTRGKIYLLLDFHRFLKPCSPDIERRLRTLARMDANTVLVIVGPYYESTPALDKEIRVMDFPYPNKDEIKAAMYSAIGSVADRLGGLEKKIKDNEEEVINSVLGLSYTEMCSAFAKSICMHRDLNIQSILKEKQEVIRKTGILEFHQPGVGMNDVGGLGNLVGFLKDRKSMFSQDAREYGLPMPKGILLIGVSGGGKSLAAKATASLYQIPLLRLDFGALFTSFVGESERTTRTAIQIAERISPCVLWLDEIEKGLSGMKSSGQTDSGVTSRVIGTLLTWMQEKSKPVFIVCTANQHENIPTEFMRAGRFDEIFFIDLPSRAERISIAEKLLLRKQRDPKNFCLAEIAAKSDGYTGAEIEKGIDNALLMGFRDNRRPITTSDIVTSLLGFKPLSKIRPEAIEAMRIWSEGRCLKANTPDVTPGGAINTAKKLDLNE